MTLVGRGDQPSCLVGTQAGCVLLCDLRDPTKDDPVVLDFNGHMGAVTSLSVHPTKPQLFASCGEDHEIHLYDLRKVSCILLFLCPVLSL
jgi:WD40 repeat protein